MELSQIPEQELFSRSQTVINHDILYSNLKNALDILNDSKKISIITHVNPDGDALGSALALWHFAKDKGKEANVLIPSKVPPNLAFLPGANNIIVYNPETDKKYLDNNDSIFILDLNQTGRIKQIQDDYMAEDAVKIVIDHHQDPKDIADYYAIDTEASSTGELILKLLRIDDNFVLTKEIADNLYTAIMTDTGSFRYPRTDAELHRNVADLIDAGADPVKIYDEVYNTTSLNRARLMGQGFANLEDYYDGRLAIMLLPKEAFEKSHAIEDDVEGFVENILSLKGVYVGILMTEVVERNEIRISFRSKDGYYIKELAQHFGGGGHDYAAGARVKNITLMEAKVLVLAEAEKMFI